MSISSAEQAISNYLLNEVTLNTTIDEIIENIGSIATSKGLIFRNTNSLGVSIGPIGYSYDFENGGEVSFTFSATRNADKQFVIDLVGPNGGIDFGVFSSKNVSFGAGNLELKVPVPANETAPMALFGAINIGPSLPSASLTAGLGFGIYDIDEYLNSDFIIDVRNIESTLTGCTGCFIDSIGIEKLKDEYVKSFNEGTFFNLKFNVISQILNGSFVNGDFDRLARILENEGVASTVNNFFGYRAVTFNESPIINGTGSFRNVQAFFDNSGNLVAAAEVYTVTATGGVGPFASSSGARIYKLESDFAETFTVTGSASDIFAKVGSVLTGAECFCSDTRVLSGDGSTVPIPDIAVGDFVMSFDGVGYLQRGTVTNVLINTTSEWIKLSNGTTVTPGHRYLKAEGGFEEIGKMLEAGGGECEVVLADGSVQKVTGERIVYSAETAHLYEESEKVVYENYGGLALEPKIVKGWKTYNFTVEKYHTYIADGVRVHNDSILSRVEPNDELVALSSDLDDAAVIRGGVLTVLDGFDFGETTDTFVALTHEFMPNPGIDISTAVANLIAAEPNLAGVPIDEDGVANNDLFARLVELGYGQWQTSFLGVPVPSLQGLIDIAAGALFSFPPQSPLDALEGAIQDLVDAVSSNITLDLEYNLSDGDVTLSPDLVDLSGILEQILPVGDLVPGISVTSLISGLGLGVAGDATLTFGAGITPEAVTPYRDGNDLLLMVDGGGDSPATITLPDYFGGDTTLISLEYADGTTGTLPSNIPAFPSEIMGTPGDDDPLNGTSQNDVIFAGDGDDRVFGAAGDDVLFGEAGQDRIFGGDGNDQLDAGAGDGSLQYLFGQNGDDTYNYQAAHSNVFINSSSENATSGNDRVILHDLNLSDLTISEATQTNANGTSVLLGSTQGNLRLANEGEHIETIEFADGTEISRIYLDAFDRVRIEATDDDNVITGTAQTDWILGGAGDDTLDAGGRNGTQLQYLFGQSGDDTYSYSTSSGRVFISNGAENASSGTDRVVFTDLNLSDITVSFLDQGNVHGNQIFLNWNDGTDSGYLRIAHEGQHIEAFEFADGTIITDFVGGAITGTIGNDSLNGTFGEDEIRGQAGDDTLNGFDGNDEIFGGSGNDMIDGGTGNDLLYGNSDDDTINGGAGDDLINGGSGTGDIAVFSGISTDYSISQNSTNIFTVFSADDGTDMLVGIESLQFSNGIYTPLELLTQHDPEPSAVIVGTDSGETIDGTSEADTIVGFGGNDQISGFGGDDEINGGDGHDILYGDGGNDVLVGGAGDDLLIGGHGDDRLDGGGEGLDDLNGGFGADTFVYTGGDVLIEDFFPDQDDDVIEISTSIVADWAELSSDIQASSSSYINAIDFGGGDYLNFGSGWNILALRESDFIFV